MGLQFSCLFNPPLRPNQIQQPHPHLPLDLWYDILALLDIDDAIAMSKASPRFFGAFIESKQGIRFSNAINSYMRSDAVYLPVGPLSSFVCSVSRNSSLEFSGLLSWLAMRFHPVLSSSIAVNIQLFTDLSSIIVLKDRGFVSVSSIVNDWTVEMKAEDGSLSSVSWILLYCASLSGYRVADFHRECDGMGKCVVIVKATNGRIAAAYNEDGFISGSTFSPNLKGFIISITDDGGCGEIFNRNDYEVGIWNHPSWGPAFGVNDVYISNNCQENERSISKLGGSYGSGSGLNHYALFGQERFRVDDYEVFKIVIE
jgi:hypothetical protein